MRFQVELLLLAGLGSLRALADDIEANDFPLSCRPACQPAVDLSDRCDRTTNDDRAERDCLCNSTDARAQYEACAACIKAAPLRSDRDDDRDDGDDDNGVEGKLRTPYFPGTPGEGDAQGRWVEEEEKNRLLTRHKQQNWASSCGPATGTFRASRPARAAGPRLLRGRSRRRPPAPAPAPAAAAARW